MRSDSPGQSTNSSSFQAHSPDLFSEDEDGYGNDEHSESASNNEAPQKSKEQVQEEALFHLESSRLHRLFYLLQGVPPPPSKTIPQISITEVLHRWKEHVDQKNSSVEEVGNQITSSGSLWKPTISFEEVLHCRWPDVKHVVFHDVHYNTSTASEDVERLSMKLHDRYVGAETSSWCNAVTSTTNSAKKRQRTRRLGNISPGCRLSHLARRRQTFSSANLAQLSSVAGSGTAGGAPLSGKGPSAARRLLMSGPSGAAERRCIMVEIKKSDKNKRIKTGNRGAQNKAVPSTSSSDSLKSIPLEKPPTQSTKRALFQSPEEQKQAALLASCSAVFEESRAQHSKRALWPSDSNASINENGKRSLDMDRTASLPLLKVHCADDGGRCVRTSRSLPFSLGSLSQPVRDGNSTSNNGSNVFLQSVPKKADTIEPTRRASDQGPSSRSTHSLSALSDLHKRKLMWAICQALKKEGITKSADVHSCKSILAHHYIHVRNDPTQPVPTSTSEHMLQVVSAKASEVVKALRASKVGQEENNGSERLLKKEEKPSKELFRDATASLNVRRSLSSSFICSNQLTSDKVLQVKRVPSARKSLTFDSIAPKSNGVHNAGEDTDEKFSLEDKRKGYGENVPLTSVKRVSRSLFISPKDDAKSLNSKKDASEQTCEDIHNKSSPSIDESSKGAVDGVNDKDEHSYNMSFSAHYKNSETFDADLKRLQASDASSLPSASTSFSTTDNDADNEASRTSGATRKFDQTKLDVIHTGSQGVLPRGDKPNPTEAITLDSSESEETKDAVSYKENMNQDGSVLIHTRTLRDTKQRAARSQATIPAKRTTRKSLSLSKRELRSSTESGGEVDSSNENHSATKSKDLGVAQVCNSNHSCGEASENKNDSSSAVESQITFKSEFGSPPFLGDFINNTQVSPFIGFDQKDEVNNSTSMLSLVVEGSSSAPKMPLNVSGEGSSSLDTNFTHNPIALAEINKDCDNVSEENVITPLLEAAALESSVCVGNGSSSSVGADLTFRGRIESLKPQTPKENSVELDLGLNINVSANILDIDENKEKSPLLEKWAERASRSASKDQLTDETANKSLTSDAPASAVTGPSTENVVESMLAWGESQLDAASESSSKLFEEFGSIFDSSSHLGSS